MEVKFEGENKSPWYASLINFFFGPTNEVDETDSNDRSPSIITNALVWIIFLFILIFNFVLGYMAMDFVSTFLSSKSDEPILVKTPFLFTALIFIASLIFLDSLIKTLKYKSRPPENLVILIFKNIGIIIGIYYLTRSW